jgi:hypothetical protein
VSYGVEIWCAGQLVSSRLARGSAVVVQALYNRLITPRGTLRGGDEESAYGFDVAGYVGEVGTDIALAALPGIVRGELMKDDRVSDVLVTATTSTASDGTIAIVLEITGVLADSEEEFALTVAATDVSVTLLGGMSS